MIIRRADRHDIKSINNLLSQVLMVHHNGRPDIFKADTKKYTDDELCEILSDNQKPVFVYCDDEGIIRGYAFCVFIEKKDNNILTDIKTLYIDDLCVDENYRGHSIGKALYDFVLSFAKSQGCYNLTLNVWSCNESAMKFYEKCGLVPQKIGMEKILN